MASTDARPVPIKNTAYRLTFPIYKSDGTIITGATALDSEVSKDAGTFADCTNEATEIATSSGVYYLDITSTEMNADCVAVVVKTSSTGAVPPTFILYPQETGDIKVDVQSNAGTSITSASGIQEVKVASIANNAITAASINADAITDAKVASDVTIASVTGAVGSVTGNVGGNVVGSVGSVTGLTAADVGAIKTKTDFLPSATAGSAGGVFIAGSNAATSITTALTANITGNLSGSVGSVTATVQADIDKINGVTITGDGQPGTEFGV